VAVYTGWVAAEWQAIGEIGHRSRAEDTVLLYTIERTADGEPMASRPSSGSARTSS
jgi:hypothetical protein